ncbi:MAG: 50S ribosomal protein L6, partial [Pseudoflavonifractor sp.]
MSRIGRMPIDLPAGVEVKIGESNIATVNGPKGTLVQQLHPAMSFQQEGNVIHVTRPNDAKENRSLHGLTRTLLANMVEGVTNGYKKELEVNGVGYRVALQGKQLVMNLGFSHQINMDAPEGITIEV